MEDLLLDLFIIIVLASFTFIYFNETGKEIKNIKNGDDDDFKSY